MKPGQMGRPRGWLSVLPLKSWMIYYIDEEWGVEGNRFPEIQPIINRDGWYYDRRRHLEWFEYRGQAFSISKDGAQFRYELQLANAHRLTQREREAYREVLRLGTAPKAVRTALASLLGSDYELRVLRDIRLEGYRAIERFETFKKDLVQE